MAEAFFRWLDVFDPSVNAISFYSRDIYGIETQINPTYPTTLSRPGKNKVGHFFYDSYSPELYYFLVGSEGGTPKSTLALKPDIPSVDGLIRVYGKSSFGRRMRLVFRLEPIKRGLTFSFADTVIDQMSEFVSVTDDYGNFWVDLFPNDLILPSNLSYYRAKLEDAKTGREIGYGWPSLKVLSSNDRLQTFSSLISY